MCLWQLLHLYSEQKCNLGTNGSAICTSICLTSLTLCIFNNREVVLPHIQNIVGICKQIINLILHYNTSRLEALLNSFM
jgi:hypothetical protein